MFGTLFKRKQQPELTQQQQQQQPGSTEGVPILISSPILPTGDPSSTLGVANVSGPGPSPGSAQTQAQSPVPAPPSLQQVPLPTQIVISDAPSEPTLATPAVVVTSGKPESQETKGGMAKPLPHLAPTDTTASSAAATSGAGSGGRNEMADDAALLSSLREQDVSITGTTESAVMTMRPVFDQQPKNRARGVLGGLQQQAAAASVPAAVSVVQQTSPGQAPPTTVAASMTDAQTLLSELIKTVSGMMLSPVITTRAVSATADRAVKYTAIGSDVVLTISGMHTTITKEKMDPTLWGINAKQRAAVILVEFDVSASMLKIMISRNRLQRLCEQRNIAPQAEAEAAPRRFKRGADELLPSEPGAGSEASLSVGASSSSLVPTVQQSVMEAPGTKGPAGRADLTPIGSASSAAGHAPPEAKRSRVSFLSALFGRFGRSASSSAEDRRSHPSGSGVAPMAISAPAMSQQVQAPVSDARATTVPKYVNIDIPIVLEAIREQLLAVAGRIYQLSQASVACTVEFRAMLFSEIVTDGKWRTISDAAQMLWDTGPHCVLCCSGMCLLTRDMFSGICPGFPEVNWTTSDGRQSYSSLGTSKSVTSDQISAASRAVRVGRIIFDTLSGVLVVPIYLGKI